MAKTPRSDSPARRAPLQQRLGHPASGAVLLALCALAPLCALASCRATEERRDVGDLVRRGQYREALALAEEQRERAPQDPRAEADLELARQARWLDLGRRASFLGDHPRALEAFLEAEAIRPGSDVVRRWVEKTLEELALEESNRAKELEAQGELELAYHAYLAAEQYWPAEPGHRAGASRMLLLMNYREGLGDAYYLAGVRALQGFALPEARRGFDASNKHRPGDPRTDDRRTELGALFAEERVRIAEDLEAEGLFRAARNEYRLALTHDAEHTEALAGLERTAAEVTVLDLLDEARRQILRRDFTQAAERIERAARRTSLQMELVDRQRDGLIEARRKHLYDRARGYESDLRFPQAIAAYDELLAEADFYLDALSRRDTLASYVRNAERLYREASLAEDPSAKRDLLRQIQLFWPEYRDVRRQLAELEP